jgi:hypothetical protein
MLDNNIGELLLLLNVSIWEYHLSLPTVKLLSPAKAAKAAYHCLRYFIVPVVAIT